MGRDSDSESSDDGQQEMGGGNAGDMTDDDLGFPTVDHKGTAFFGTGSDEESEGEKIRNQIKKKKLSQGGFETFGFSYPVYKGLKHKGYRVPTPIQRKAIPLVLQGKDMVAMARTGSGKTAAFLLPLLERLKEHSKVVGARGVVLSPTRELAMQTMKFFKELGKYTDLRSCLLVGGDSMEDQFDFLSQNPDVIIATPGRLIHHLVETRMSLKSVEYAVFDEADRLFEMGFQQQCQDILNEMSENRQTLLFSATLPKTLVEFTRAGLKDPELVRLDTDIKISEKLNMAFYTVRSTEKIGAFLYLVDRLVAKDELTIVFVATRHHVEYLHTVLTYHKVESTFIYGSMDQSARKINLAKFRNKKAPIMIVTDVAARGIDVPQLDNVINFDFPSKPKLFIHRVGRAARAGRSGTAYSLVEQTTEFPYVVDLMLFLGRSLTNKKNEADEEDQVYYGRFPQTELDAHLEMYRMMFEHYPDVQALQKVSGNAYKLYYKTRAAASPSSCRRAKELDFGPVHPWLLGSMNEKEEEKNEFVKHLQSFRPSATIFELRELGKQKHAGEEVMRQKRLMHNRTINSTAKKKAKGPSVDLQAEFFPKPEENDVRDGDDDDDDEAAAEGSEDGSDDESEGVMGVESTKGKKRSASEAGVGGGPGGKKKKGTRSTTRDPNFYMNYHLAEDHDAKGYSIRDQQSQRIEDAILDLNPEDDSALMKKRTAMKWDMKKKRYVQVNLGLEKESLSAKLRQSKNESGAWIKKDSKGKDGKGKNDKNIYDEWMKRSKNRIQHTGEDEDTRYGGKKAMGFGKYRHNTKEAVPNAHARSELKTPQDMRKAKKIQEQNKIKQMSKIERKIFLTKEGKIGNKSQGRKSAGSLGKDLNVVPSGVSKGNNRKSWKGANKNEGRKKKR